MKIPTLTLTGPELLRRVVNQIIDHPETWDQLTWHCGSSHCVGGWTQLLAGLEEDYGDCGSQAKLLLGLSHRESDWLFSVARTLPEIHGFAAAVLAGTYDEGRFDYREDANGYTVLTDPDGYDMGGFHADTGLNRDGRRRDDAVGLQRFPEPEEKT